MRASPPPSARHPDPAVQLLLDRAVIEDLFHTYAAAVDRRDFSRVGACFAEDVHGAFGGEERHGRDALVEYISGVRFFHTTMHMMGNLLVDVRGAVARLDGDAMIKHRALLEDGRDFQMNMSASGYRERLARRGDGWHIVERAVPLAAGSASGLAGPGGADGVRSEDPAVRWLLDRAEIHDLLAGYAVAVDTRQWERVAACFAERFHATYLGHAFDDLEALMQFIRGVEIFGWTRHFFARPRLAITGDTAVSETRALISSRMKDDPKGKNERTSFARYRDELVREGGRWRVAQRVHDLETEPVPSLASAPRSADPSVTWLLDRAALADDITSSAEEADRRDGTLSFPGNQLVAFEGEAASVETYVYRLRAVGPGQFTAWHEDALRWEDAFARENGRWQRTHREVRSNEIERNA